MIVFDIPATQDEFDAIAAKLKAEGEQIGTLESSATPAGQLKRDGVVLGWQYVAGTITISVLHAPPFFGGSIEKKIRAWFAKAEATAAPAQPAQ